MEKTESESDFINADFQAFISDQIEAERLTSPDTLLETRVLNTQKDVDELYLRRAFKAKVVGDKLLAVGEREIGEGLLRCHCEESFLRCGECGCVKRVFNRCEWFACPLCAPRQARRRLEGLLWWVEKMKQPKHLVLTLKNVRRLDKDYVEGAKKSLQRFRRNFLGKFCSAGMWAMEVTNKGKGWHLHFHLVVEMGWIPVRAVSAEWEKASRGKGKIVWLESAKKGSIEKNLPKYVTKYVGKGFDISEWSSDELGQFTRALKGGRVFGVFGKLVGERSRWKEELAGLRKERARCECGACCWKVFSWNELKWKEFALWGLESEQSVRKRLESDEKVFWNTRQRELLSGSYGKEVALGYVWPD